MSASVRHGLFHALIMPSIDELPNTRELQRCLNTLKRLNAHHECVGAPEAYWRSKQGRRDKREFSQLRGAQRAIANLLHNQNLP